MPMLMTLSSLSACTYALGRRLRPRLERSERLGRLTAERADERAVVLVRDLAASVVELELLERAERPVAALQQLDLAPFELARLVEAVVARLRVEQERPRHEQDTRDREHRAKDNGPNHASTGTL